MPKIPEAVSKRMGSVAAGARDRAGGAAKKLRQLDPKVARASAAQGAGGAKDVVRLAVAYAKQETVDPIKQLGRYVAFGASGAIFMGFGLVLMTLGVLRRIQTGTGTRFTRTTAWVPYTFTAAVAVVVLAVVALGWRRSIRDLTNGDGA